MAHPITGLTTAARALGFARGGWVPTGQLRWFVGRQHVATSALAIARHVYHRLGAPYPRPVKRALVRAALLAHQDNRALYRYVMRGR